MQQARHRGAVQANCDYSCLQRPVNKLDRCPQVGSSARSKPSAKRLRLSLVACASTVATGPHSGSPDPVLANTSSKVQTGEPACICQQPCCFKQGPPVLRGMPGCRGLGVAGLQNTISVLWRHRPSCAVCPWLWRELRPLAQEPARSWHAVQSICNRPPRLWLL